MMNLNHKFETIKRCMIDLNYKNHKFELMKNCISTYKCLECGVFYMYFMDISPHYYICSENRLPTGLKNLSCEECMIKNIIE